MKKLTANQLLRMACVYADDNRTEFLDAWRTAGNDPEAVRVRADTEAFLKQLRAYAARRWGAKTAGPFAGAESVPITEIIKRSDVPTVNLADGA